MALTLRDVLAFDALRDAAPEVLAGGDELNRPVRWVHSSEIYEISPLLAGGELLLTTGLGLAGADAGARRHYVREIAGRHVAGVALELGRSFVEVPPELVDEARRHALPLVALRQVVPFIRISESVNTAIVEHRTPGLRMEAELSGNLDRALAAGAGVARLLAIATVAVRAPLVLVGGNGALVAAHGVDDDRAAWSVADDPAALADVPGDDHGRLFAGHGSPLPEAQLAVAAQRTAVALAIASMRGGARGERTRRSAAALVDLLAGTTVGSAAAVVRDAGAALPSGGALVGVAVDAPDPRQGTALLDSAARVLGAGPPLRADVRGVVLGVLGATVAAAEDALRAALERLTTGGVTAVVGPAVGSAAPARDLARSLRTARSALDLAHGTAGVTTSRALALELTLAAHPDPSALDAMVSELIGPLVEHDRRSRSRLVRTLEVYLRHGCSPTRAAAVLHVGRQSLYQRLERIEALLGFPVAAADTHAALVAATAAHRLRSDQRRKSSA